MQVRILNLIVCVLFSACSSEEQYPGFKEWYKVEVGDDLPAKGKAYSMKVSSDPMQVKGILRSMEGPFNVKIFHLDSESPLIWIKGYKTIIKDTRDKVQSSAFMCHNNLNLKDKNDLPWKVPTLGSKTRLFTLTEGQTKVMLPEGFGVPITPDQEMELVSQVLNHNFPDIDQYLKHEVEVYYQDEYKNSGIKPLYQQSIFVTKQTAGPKGLYGVKPGNETVEVGGNDSAQCHHVNHAHCTPNIQTEHYNPFRDQYRREYTGHWVIDPDYEELHTNVTPMLNLSKDTRVHYIGVHVHPFSESLELRDLTTNKSVWKANVENFTDKIGIKHIDHYSSKKGIILYEDHQYELVSIYKNTTGDRHTAMATMFLYLEDD